VDAPNSIPQRRIDTQVRKFRGKLLVASRNRQAFELSETAEFIFRQIDGKRTIQEIGGMVAEKFGAPLEMAVDDCAELIAELVEGKAIDVMSAGEGHEYDQ
jgi:methyltransferase-like protein